MKTSLEHLPRPKQRELRTLVGLILSTVPDVRMIILYGSYARGKYVEYDTRWEFGVRTEFRSDYDIEVILAKASPEASRELSKVSEMYYELQGEEATLPHMIHDHLRLFRHQLRDIRPFYVDMVREGVLLYIQKGLAPPVVPDIESVDPKKIYRLAKEYYNEKTKTAEDFLDTAQYSISKDRRPLAAFMLHQAAENLLHCVRLVYTLYSPKLHDLEKLYKVARKFDKRLRKVFPCDTPHELAMFDLLCAAYIEGRYNSGFVVTSDDMDFLVPRVELLLATVREVCEERVKFYRTEAFAAPLNNKAK